MAGDRLGGSREDGCIGWCLYAVVLALVNLDRASSEVLLPFCVGLGLCTCSDDHERACVDDLIVLCLEHQAWG